MKNARGEPKHPEQPTGLGMRRKAPRVLWVGLSLSVGLSASPAHATYSIVATDTVTKQSGIAATSCLIGSGDVAMVAGIAPGKGALAAQALLNSDARNEGTALLVNGATASEVLARITAPDFDTNADLRQYGIADVGGRTAAYTGARTDASAGDRQGAIGAFVYSAQGNFLTSVGVVERAADAFEGSGCDLAERLLLALEAGALQGEGDRRCTAKGIPSDSAYLGVYDSNPIHVALVEIHVPSVSGKNPLPELRAQFDAWRAEHACPTPPLLTDGGSPASDAGNEPPDAGEDADADPAPPDGEPAEADPASTTRKTEACGCVLPRGRTTSELVPAALAVAVWLRRRQASRRVRAIPSAVPRE